MSDLIISAPHLQTLRQRFASTLVTLVFWVFWFYLWLPLLTLAGWLMGIDMMYFQMIELSGYRSLLNRMSEFSATVATLGMSLAGWAFYNFFRFRGVDRRRPGKLVSDEELCAVFNVNIKLLTASRNSSFIAVQISDAGEIEGLSPERPSIGSERP